MPPLAFQNHCGVLQGKENLCFAFRDFGKLISEMSNLYRWKMMETNTSATHSILCFSHEHGSQIWIRCVAAVASTPHNPSQSWKLQLDLLYMKSHISKKRLLILDVSGQRYLWFGLNGTHPKPKTRENVSTRASVYVNQQLYFHFVEDPGDAVAKMDVCVCLCVCVSVLQILQSQKWNCFYHAILT